MSWSAILAPARQRTLESAARRPFRKDIAHLWGSASTDPRETVEEIDRGAGRRPLHVFLGYQREAAGARWLTYEEVSAATVRALDEGASGIVAGQLDPWTGRP